MSNFTTGGEVNSLPPVYNDVVIVAMVYFCSFEFCYCLLEHICVQEASKLAISGNVNYRKNLNQGK